MQLSVADNSVLVTASSSGLGLGAAKAFAREGANVAICARTKSGLLEARDAVDASGPGDVLAVPTDLTVESEVEDLISRVVEEWGGLDHLVTSAGRVEGGSVDDLANDDWYDAVDTLLMSAVWTIEAARPHLEASDAGTIVMVTSASVAEPMPNLTLSNSVRRAVLGLAKDLADDLAPAVRVNSVLPYHHVSDERLADTDQDVIDGWTSDIPLEMVGNPDRFGDVCAFLSSDRTEYLHGASIPLDGGWLRE